jgi:hypothetical protein
MEMPCRIVNRVARRGAILANQVRAEPCAGVDLSENLSQLRQIFRQKFAAFFWVFLGGTLLVLSGMRLSGRDRSGILRYE